MVEVLLAVEFVEPAVFVGEALQDLLVVAEIDRLQQARFVGAFAIAIDLSRRFPEERRGVVVGFRSNMSVDDADGSRVNRVFVEALALVGGSGGEFDGVGSDFAPGGGGSRLGCSCVRRADWSRWLAN